MTTSVVPTCSTAFTAKYRGYCNNAACHKRGDIEQGDCCCFIDGDIMHLRCARATQRRICEQITGEMCYSHDHSNGER